MAASCVFGSISLTNLADLGRRMEDGAAGTPHRTSTQRSAPTTPQEKQALGDSESLDIHSVSTTHPKIPSVPTL